MIEGSFVLIYRFNFVPTNLELFVSNVVCSAGGRSTLVVSTSDCRSEATVDWCWFYKLAEIIHLMVFNKFQNLSTCVGKKQHAPWRLEFIWAVVFVGSNQGVVVPQVYPRGWWKWWLQREHLVRRCLMWNMWVVIFGDDELIFAK